MKTDLRLDNADGQHLSMVSQNGRIEVRDPNKGTRLSENPRPTQSKQTVQPFSADAANSRRLWASVGALIFLMAGINFEKSQPYPGEADIRFRDVDINFNDRIDGEEVNRAISKFDENRDGRIAGEERKLLGDAVDRLGFTFSRWHMENAVSSLPPDGRISGSATIASFPDDGISRN